jgi:hypothetical protein
MSATAARTAPRSGAPCAVSGVGTQITTAPAPAITSGSRRAVNPWARISRTSASEMSSTCERPACGPATTPACRSRPATRSPAAVAARASGGPT